MIEDSQVGQQIRMLREGRGWSLRELAQRSGLSANAISRIERGENSPTVSSLRAMAEAFNVPITDFFEEDHSKTCVHVQKGEGMWVRNRDTELESLGFGLSSQQLEPFRMIIDSGTETVSEPISHPGQEFVYCIRGQLDYVVGEELYRLSAGDSLLFHARMEHRWKNTSRQPAEILLVFQASRDQHLARERHLEGGDTSSRDG